MKTHDIRELEICRFVGTLIELSTYRQRKNTQGRVTIVGCFLRARRTTDTSEDLSTIFYSLHNTKNFISQERIEFIIITLFDERIFTFYKEWIREKWSVVTETMNYCKRNLKKYFNLTNLFQNSPKLHCTVLCYFWFDNEITGISLSRCDF